MTVDRRLPQHRFCDLHHCFHNCALNKMIAGGQTMIDKCANPECPETLLYLRSGAMYSVDAPTPQGGTGMPTRFFWLCEACSKDHKLSCNGKGELKLESIDTPDPACRSACSRIRVQRISNSGTFPASGMLIARKG
jgi:hypothetical protein